MSIKIVSERTKAEKEWEKRKIEIEEMLENAIIEICYFFEGTGTNVGERLIELVHYCAQKLMQKDIKDEEIIVEIKNGNEQALTYLLNNIIKFYGTIKILQRVKSQLRS